MSRLVSIEVAYADDHKIVRSGIAGIVNTFDNCKVVLEASDGRELISQLEKIEVHPSICMLDVFMPVMNGLEAMIEIRNRWPSMRFLVLTGQYTEYYLVKLLRAGANGYLIKDCGPSELNRALHSIYEHGMYYSDTVTTEFVRSIFLKQTLMPDLSESETFFIKLACTDMSYMQIAEKMSITTKSVEYIRSQLFKKLHLLNRSSLVMFAVEAGIVPVSHQSHL